MDFASLFPTSTLNSVIFEGKQVPRASYLSILPFFWKVLRCADTIFVLWDFSSYCLHAIPAYLSACQLHLTSVSISVNHGAVNREGAPALRAKLGEQENISAKNISYLI